MSIVQPCESALAHLRYHFSPVCNWQICMPMGHILMLHLCCIVAPFLHRNLDLSSLILPVRIWSGRWQNAGREECRFAQARGFAATEQTKNLPQTQIESEPENDCIGRGEINYIYIAFPYVLRCDSDSPSVLVDFQQLAAFNLLAIRWPSGCSVVAVGWCIAVVLTSSGFHSMTGAFGRDGSGRIVCSMFVQQKAEVRLKQKKTQNLQKKEGLERESTPGGEYGSGLEMGIVWPAILCIQCVDRIWIILTHSGGSTTHCLPNNWNRNSAFCFYRRLLLFFSSIVVKFFISGIFCTFFCCSSHSQCIRVRLLVCASVALCVIHLR